MAGLVITSILLVRNIPGAMLIGIISTTLLGLIIGIIRFEGLFSTPPSIEPTFLQRDIFAVFRLELLPVVITFLILAIFCYPLIKMISGGVEISEGVMSYPTVAPVLILIGIYCIYTIKTILRPEKRYSLDDVDIYNNIYPALCFPWGGITEREILKS